MSFYLNASDYSKQISRANKALTSSAKSVIWKGYHDFQSLYMKGLLDGNEQLQFEALKGLIKASKALDIDSTRYKNAIKTLNPTANIKELKEIKTPNKKENGELKTILLKKVYVKDGYLVAECNSALSKKRVQKMVLKRKKSYLYVFDLSSMKAGFSIKRIKSSKFKEIRVAQFEPKIVRVVIEVLHPYKPEWKIKGHKLLITLPKNSTIHKQKKESVQKNSLKTKRDTKDKGLNFSKYTVVIDPGHGGGDIGAMGYKKLKEKKAVLAIAKKVEGILKKRGFKVYLTRNKDKFVSLKKRTKFANRKKADFFISIHANAVAKYKNKAKGIETYFLSPARSKRAKRVAALENSADISDMDFYSKETFLSLLNREKIIESNKLAIDLQKQILSSLRSKYSGVVDNGVREGPFWILVGAQMPAVLIEIGYITHPIEAKRLFNSHYQRLLAEGIANGIESYIRHNK